MRRQARHATGVRSCLRSLRAAHRPALRVNHEKKFTRALNPHPCACRNRSPSAWRVSPSTCVIPPSHRRLCLLFSAACLLHPAARLHACPASPPATFSRPRLHFLHYRCVYLFLGQVADTTALTAASPYMTRVRRLLGARCGTHGRTGTLSTRHTSLLVGLRLQPLTCLPTATPIPFTKRAPPLYSTPHGSRGGSLLLNLLIPFPHRDAEHSDTSSASLPSCDRVAHARALRAAGRYACRRPLS